MVQVTAHKTAHGFALVRDRVIQELDSRARVWRHLRSGAELLSIRNDDREKAFGIVFRTPPPDATGLPHILEHAVLGGSRRYPIRNPLDERLKGSLVTSVHVVTYPDKTCYAGSSMNLIDLYQLADVLLDAVFSPLLTRQTFQQVGWHYELEDLDSPLTLNGNVLNEQRGNFSAPARLIEHHSQMPLFPDTPYGVPRGGDPAHIPGLTYERLLAYHRTFYHPSNARLFFYGDDDPEERLRYLDTWLRDYDRLAVDSAFPLQPPFDRPRWVTVPYDAGPEAGDGRGWITVNWVLDEVGEPETVYALRILEHILVGTPASPLRAALTGAGLGEDLAGLGLFAHVRQMYFSTGLKGVCPTDAARVETLIETTLRALAEEGIDPDMVSAALNTVAFRLREAHHGRLSRGLALLWERVTPTWVHDGDPLALLAFEAPLQAIAERIERGERTFERLIRRYLVDNTHRATVLLVPDPQLRPAEAERRQLAKVRAAMSEPDLRALVEDTHALRRAQETPDLPEALAVVPTLGLGDLDVQAPQIPCQVLETRGCTTLHHDLFTGGIVYLDLAFDLHTLPQALVPYAPLLGQALIGTGTEREDLTALAQRIGRDTGGITSRVLVSAKLGSPRAVGRLVLRGKATASQADDLLAILHDVLLTARLDNRARVAQLVRKARAAIQSNLLPDGATVVGRRLGARYGEAGWLAEQVHGIAQLVFLRELEREIERDWPAVLSRLEEVRRRLLNRQALICNVTVDRANWARLAPGVADLLSSLPAGTVETADWTPDSYAACEGLSVPTRVNYVAKGADLYALGYAPHGSIAAIARYLEMAWLSRRVRAQGGAYGAHCIFDPLSGLFACRSYRDPNLLATIEAYDGTAQFLRAHALDDAERVRNIVGAVGRLDASQSPDALQSADAQGYTSMLRHLCGERDRQRFRDQLLDATAEDFHAFADVLRRVADQGSVVVMGSRDAIDAANAARAGWLEVTEVL